MTGNKPHFFRNGTKETVFLWTERKQFFSSVNRIKNEVTKKLFGEMKMSAAWLVVLLKVHNTVKAGILLFLSLQRFVTEFEIYFQVSLKTSHFFSCYRLVFPTVSIFGIFILSKCNSNFQRWKAVHPIIVGNAADRWLLCWRRKTENFSWSESRKSRPLACSILKNDSVSKLFARSESH